MAPKSDFSTGLILHLHRSTHRNKATLGLVIQIRYVGHVGRHLSAHTSRNTSRKMVGRDRFCDHGACANYAAVSYAHARTVY